MSKQALALAPARSSLAGSGTAARSAARGNTGAGTHESADRSHHSAQAGGAPRSGSVDRHKPGHHGRLPTLEEGKTVEFLVEPQGRCCNHHPIHVVPVERVDTGRQRSAPDEALQVLPDEIPLLSGGGSSSQRCSQGCLQASPYDRRNPCRAPTDHTSNPARGGEQKAHYQIHGDHSAGPVLIDTQLFATALELLDPVAEPFVEGRPIFLPF